MNRSNSTPDSFITMLISTYHSDIIIFGGEKSAADSASKIFKAHFRQTKFGV